MSHGRVEVLTIESPALRGNVLGDPHIRQIPVYLPPGYDADKRQRYPVVYVLTGFTGFGAMLLNRQGWGEGLDQRMDRLIASGACRPMILVMPDCFTRLGGSQYLDSPATGAYETHLVRELVPTVDAKFRTLKDRDHRGLMGKSSGGYGAIVQAMRHPDVFGAFCCHSGDMAFEHCYQPDFAAVVHAVSRHGSLEAFLAEFERSPKKSKEQTEVINMLAMAACYSPNPRKKPPLAFDLPFDPATGETDPPVWARWLAWDPIRMLESHREALASLRLIWFDCGRRDEFRLDLGARILGKRLRAMGLPHEHDEFDDTHMNIQYRYDVSLARLGEAMA